MKKEKYLPPKLEVVAFDGEDVITNSGFDVGGGEGDIGEGDWA